jgi:hypothetical protein
MTTTNPSRRRALAGLLAVAPTVAVANSFGGTPLAGDDAELLSFKPEVDQLLGEWIRQKTKDRLKNREFEGLHLAKFGFGRDDAPEVDWKDPEFIAYDREFRCLIDEFYSGESDDELELEHWDLIHDKLYPLAKNVLSHQATTLDGLRLQTRVLIIYHNNEIWDPVLLDATEHSQPNMYAFFASLCGVLDIPFPPVPERWQA